LSGGASTGYQTISNAISSQLNLGFSNKYFGARISGVYRTSDNYKDPNGNKVQYTQYNKANFSANLVSNFSKFNRFKLDFIYDHAWDIGYAALPMDVSLAKASIYSFTYERFFFNNKLQQIEIKLYGNNIFHEMDDTKRPDVPIHMDMPGKSDTYGGYLNLKWNNLNNHLLIAKADAFVNYSIAEMTMYPFESAPMFMLTWPDVKRIVAGLFVADRWEINEKFILSGSLRFDRAVSELQSEFAKDHLRVFGYDVDDPFKQNIWNVIIEPEYQINDSFKLILTGAFKQRLPTITEQFGFYLYNAYDGYDYIGNPELSPESALQSDLTLSYRAKALNLRLTGFYYYLTDYIVGEIDPELSTMTIGANGVKIFTSIDHANMYGIEVSSIWTKNSLVWVNVLNYTNGNDMYGEILPQLPPLKLTSTFTYEWKNWSVTPEVITSAAKNIVRESFGETKTPGWMVLNLRGSYQLKEKAVWKIEFGIENLTNNYYSEFLDWGDIPRPGRNFYMNLSFQF
jgi:iron complex outermembrane receptor protein